MLSSLLIALFTGKVHSYGLCNANEYRFKGKKVSAPIQGTATKSIVRNGETRLVTIGGTINVLNGCSFETKDIILDGPFRVQLYGAQGEADPNAVLLTTEELRIPTKDKVYTFIQTAGNWVNYDDFTQINFFDPDTKSIIGIAVLGEGGAVTNPSPAPPQNSKEPTKDKKINGTIKVAFGSVTLVSLIMSILL
jgi:hypothetical protein